MIEQRDLFIALYDSDEVRSAELQRRLSLMGHRTVVFANTASLLNMLGAGHRFDLLLVPLQDDDLTDRILSVCEETKGLPILLLVDQTQWAHLLLHTVGFEWCDAFDFDVSRAVDAELDWRMRALLSRRSRSTLGRIRPAKKMAWGDYRFLDGNRVVLHRDREVLLQPRQFEFALELFRNMDRVLTRGWLRDVLWGDASQRENSRAFDVCAACVRKKLALHTENGFVLKAVYGEGYMLFDVKASTQDKNFIGAFADLTQSP